LAILAYILALFFILITLLFFKIWESGKYFKVATISIAIRILLIPLFEFYGSKIVPSELPELLLWYGEWHKYIEVEGFQNIILNPFSIEGPRGMYIYYTMYAGWFLDLTNAEDMIPLRLITSALSLYIIVFAHQIIHWLYGFSVTIKQVFIITNWPFWLYYSTMLGRTMPSVIIPLIGILAMYKLLEVFSIKYLVIVLITFWLTLILRTFYALFFLSTFTSFFIYKILLTEKKNEKILQKISLIVFSIVSIIILKNLFNAQDAFILIAENLTQSDQVEGDASGSSYLTNFYPQKYFDLLYYMPVQGIYFLLSPMIWDIHKVEQLISCIFALILFYLFIKSVFQNKNAPQIGIRAKMVILNMIFVSMILGAGVKNAGAAQRWRLPITTILLCVVMSNNFANFRTKTSKER
jgi:hypothetical protein